MSSVTWPSPCAIRFGPYSYPDTCDYRIAYRRIGYFKTSHPTPVGGTPRPWPEGAIIDNAWVEFYVENQDVAPDIEVCVSSYDGTAPPDLSSEIWFEGIGEVLDTVSIPSQEGPVLCRARIAPQYLDLEGNTGMAFRLAGDTESEGQASVVMRTGNPKMWVAYHFEPPPPVASFTTEKRGESGHGYRFTNTSSGTIAYSHWDSGDGREYSCECCSRWGWTHYYHPWRCEEDYTVTLTVTGPGGSDSFSEVIHIEEGIEVCICHLWIPEDQVGSNVVQFCYVYCGKSTRPISWSWDFGDGTTSTEQYPIHEYPEACEDRVYPVTLQVWGEGGCTYVDTKNIWVRPTRSCAEIVDAHMVTPNELGIGINVEYPASLDAQTPRYVRFTGTINERYVDRVFDVTEYTTPGELWGYEPGNDNQMFERDGDIKATTPLRINLAETEVPRFSSNATFVLSGTAYYEGGLESEMSEKEVEILLPVVVLHGYIHPHGYPLPWYKGGNPITYDNAYKNLGDFLVENGYEHEDQYEHYDLDKYRTLWDPSNFTYSNPWLATPQLIEADLDGLLQEVWEHNYACKANLIGHSFGGLVATYYASVGDVSKVITVGTPHTGATRFYEAAFEESSNRGAFDDRLKIKEGPYKDEQCILPWTAPTYSCLFDETEGEIPLLYSNTFAADPSPGTDYFSIFAQDSKTLEKLTLQRRGDWYKIVGKSPGSGDGYILASSARALGQRLPVSGSTHAFLCNDIETQQWIHVVLNDEVVGCSSYEGDEASWHKGTMSSGEIRSDTVSVGPGVSQAIFDLSWQGSDLDLIVYDPNGLEISAETASTYPGAVFVEGDGYEQCIVRDPVHGDWMTEIRAIDVPGGGEEYIAIVHLLGPEPPALPASIDIDPNTLNLASEGEWLTGYIELPEGYDPVGIDLSTVLLNEAVPAVLTPTAVADHDSNGIADRMVKFDRAVAITFLSAAEEPKAWVDIKGTHGPPIAHGAEIEVTVSGYLIDGTKFAGTDIVRVINPATDQSAGAVLQVFPSPMTSTARISYEVASAGPLSLRVYDAAGRLVRTLVDSDEVAGRHEVSWDRKSEDGQQVTAGVYFVKLEQQGRAGVAKVLVIR